MIGAEWTTYRRNIKRHRALLLMALPGMFCIGLFCYVPMAGLEIAFKDYTLRDGIFGSPWTGWANFTKLFASGDFPVALRNTMVISLLRLVSGFAAPLILALMLNEVRLSAYKRSIQTLTYLPYLLSWVILGGIFLMLFAANGPVNAMLSLVSIQPIPFLSHDIWFIILLIFTGVWQSAGYGAVIYLAAISGIDPQLYEAARADGAGRWRQIRHVTLPCLTPTIIVLVILSLGQFLSAGFDQIYNMYNPLVYDVSDIIDTYVLRRLQTMDFGLATAAGFFKSVVGMFLIIASNAIARRMSGGEYGVW